MGILFHTIYLLHIIFSSVLSHISPEMHEVSVNIKQIIRISTESLEKIFFSIASVPGYGNPCTDAVVFAVASLVWGSVGQRNGDSVYRRSALRAKVFGLPFACGRKCAEVFMNTIRNLMKTRDLACGNIGRKYVKNFQYGIAVSEKITTFASQ